MKRNGKNEKEGVAISQDDEEIRSTVGWEGRMEGGGWDGNNSAGLVMMLFGV